MNINILRKHKIKDLRGELKEQEEHFLNELKNIKDSKLFNLSDHIEKFYIFDYFMIKHEQYILNTFHYNHSMTDDNMYTSYSCYYEFTRKKDGDYTCARKKANYDVY